MPNGFLLKGESDGPMDLVLFGAFPELKTAFWLDVHQSKIARTDTLEDLRSAEFPRVVVEFGSFDRRCKVDAALCEDLYALMTTSIDTRTKLGDASLPPAAVQLSVVALDLSLAWCTLTPDSLDLIESFLDRTSARPNRQLALRMLDLSGYEMDPMKLAVTARIAHKYKIMHQVEELRLGALIPTKPPALRETPRDFLEIVWTTFYVTKLPALSSNYSREQPDARYTKTPGMRSISLAGNHLPPTFFAAHFSAMRYGYPFEEDATDYALLFWKRSASWLWIAFGLFYPRPKRFARAFKLCSSGQLTLHRDLVKNAVKTLRNPAAELVCNDEGGEDNSMATQPPDSLMVCTVKKGAVVEFSEKGSRYTARSWTYTLHERSELEVLCERTNSSFCVVVPVVSLEWVASEFVERVEREPLELSRSEQKGWCNAKVDPYMVDLEDLRALLSLMVDIFGRSHSTLISRLRSHAAVHGPLREPGALGLASRASR